MSSRTYLLYPYTSIHPRWDVCHSPWSLRLNSKFYCKHYWYTLKNATVYYIPFKLELYNGRSNRDFGRKCQGGWRHSRRDINGHQLGYELIHPPKQKYFSSLVSHQYIARLTYSLLHVNFNPYTIRQRRIWDCKTVIFISFWNLGSFSIIWAMGMGI